MHTVILLLLLLSVAPTYLLASVSFKNPLQYRYDLWGISFPLRTQNYPAAWEIAGQYVWNTLYVAVTGCAGVVILSLIGGYVFARMRFPSREVLYYGIVALLTVPWVLNFVPAYMLYYRLGLLNTRWVLIVPTIAGGQVFGIFMMRSVIAGIPEEIYEAARCDGAGVGSLIMRITLPLSLPGLAIITVVTFVSAWNSFLWPLVTIHDKSLQVVSVGMYQLSQSVGNTGLANWGPLFAGYVIASLPLILLFVLLGKLYVEGLVGAGMKV